MERDPTIQVLAEADDGAQALDLIGRHHPDVVVLDLHMPRLSGLDAIGQIRRGYPDVKIIVLTAYDDPPYVLAALRAGAKGYLLKTAGPDELTRAVHVVQEGRSALDPAVTQCVVDTLSGTCEPQSKDADALSERELEVLRLAARGHTNRAIGQRLNISDRTVHSHLINIFSKMGVNTRTEAALKAVRLGWLSLEDTVA
jgi:DNA-binding NarL/FixJ family response regulator